MNPLAGFVGPLRGGGNRGRKGGREGKGKENEKRPKGREKPPNKFLVTALRDAASERDCVDAGLRRNASVPVRHEVRHSPDDGDAAPHGVPLRRAATQDGVFSQAAVVRRQARRTRHVRQHPVPLRRRGR